MAIELVDKKLSCVGCKNTFIFTKGEQEFFLEKGFAPPTRCSECRKIRKKERRRRRRQLLRTIQAAESVHVEVSAGPEIATKADDSASVGIVSAEQPEKKKEKKNNKK